MVRKKFFIFLLSILLLNAILIAQKDGVFEKIIEGSSMDNNDKLIQEMEKLEELLEIVKSLEIDKYSKEKIQKCIAIEIDIKRHDIIKFLGSKELKKIKIGK
jgi:hypothetical protein